MFNTQQPRKALSELEHLVMEFLWSQESATADDVREALGSSRVLKDSTVRTVLRRLESKGYAAHRVEGRTFLYRGLERPQNVAVRAVRQIIDKFCGGSVEELLVGMVENELLDRQELQELAKKIGRLKTRRGGR
jgi:BlaI family transcriptional regulator, penicillinase repressor